MSRAWSLSLSAGFVAALSLSAAEQPAKSPGDWPRWRGPLANGVAPAATPPTSWSETENVKWKMKIPGFGTSTPIVWKDRVYLVTAIPTGKKVESAPAPAAPAEQSAAPGGGPADGPGGGRRRGGGGGGGMRSEKPNEAYQFSVIAVDRKTGKIVWQKVAREEVPHEGHHRDHGFASSSPVTDGEHLYVSFGSRGIYCYDLDGQLKWDTHLGTMQTRGSFGEGASPALHGDTLVINWDHEGEDFVVALDKRTGKERWRQKRDEPTSWSTPLILEHDGKAQAIISATNRVRSYDLKNGELLWECGGMTANAIPTPVSDFGHVYAISGFRGAALLAIKLGKSGDLTDSDSISWKHTKATPYVPSPLLSGERLYFYAGNNGTLSAFNAKTGQPLFESERIDGLLGGVYASPVAANGNVYLVGRDGNTVVIKDGDKLERVTASKLEDKFDASAAIVGKEIFLRGHQYLYCIAEG